MRISIALILVVVITSCNQNPSVEYATEKVVTVDSLMRNKNSLITKSHIKNVDNKDGRIITFRKNNGLYIAFHNRHIDSAWTSISVGHWPYKMLQQYSETDLQEHIENIDSCWNYMANLGEINITSLGLSSPRNYPDIAANQVRAFNEDLDWKSNPSNNIEAIMLKYDVYKPINDFLKLKGFAISGFAMEKMSTISEEEQKSMGIENPVSVPSPMAINIYVEKTNN